jgi:hypothetical protein
MGVGAQPQIQRPGFFRKPDLQKCRVTGFLAGKKKPCRCNQQQEDQQKSKTKFSPPL